MRNARHIFGALALTAALVPVTATAAPVQCSATSDPGNVHYYEVIPSLGVTWEQARDLATASFFQPPGQGQIQGHLATITSAGEDLCIDELRRAAALDYQVWVGGYQQPDSASPGDGWQWVNGDGSIPGVNGGAKYANWRGGEPNDGKMPISTETNIENYLAVGLFNEFVWNDTVPVDPPFISGYVVEYDGEVPAADCTAESPCNPSGVQEISLPAGFTPPPGATITQTLIQNPLVPNPLEAVKFPDPRVIGGVCSDRRYLDVFKEVISPDDPSMYGMLILPPWLCGSPQFAVLRSDLNFIIEDDVIRSRQLPEEIFGTATFDCAVDGVAGDLQTRGVFVWQPDDRTTTIPNHALELTNGCGSRRGATKGGSFFVLNLHVDWGIPFGSDNVAVLNSFKVFTLGKFGAADLTLIDARAKRLLTRSQFRSLRRQLVRARNTFVVGSFSGNFGPALGEISTFIADVQGAGITPSTDNVEGNLQMRGENIEFNIMKINEALIP